MRFMRRFINDILNFKNSHRRGGSNVRFADFRAIDKEMCRRYGELIKKYQELERQVVEKDRVAIKKATVARHNP